MNALQYKPAAKPPARAGVVDRKQSAMHEPSAEIETKLESSL